DGVVTAKGLHASSGIDAAKGYDPFAADEPGGVECIATVRFHARSAIDTFAAVGLNSGAAEITRRAVAAGGLDSSSAHVDEGSAANAACGLNCVARGSVRFDTTPGRERALHRAAPAYRAIARDIQRTAQVERKCNPERGRGRAVSLERSIVHQSSF